MDKKVKAGSVAIGICLLVIAVLLGGIVYFFYNANMEKNNLQAKINELETTIKEKDNKVSELENKISKVSNVVNDEEKLSDSEKNEIFSKAVKDELVLIDTMIGVKDFKVKDFSDKEIILALPDSSETKIFSSYDDESGFYKKASIIDVENSAKKLFGKEINVKSIQNDNSIRIINQDVIVEVRSGVGIVNVELISIEEKESNEYEIEFKYISGDINEVYKLTVSLFEENIIYKSLEK